jgi:A/G-specific adenine glycosylase
LKSLRKLQGLSDSQRAAFQTGLLAWYDAHARDLPWREDRDPYRVWLSEIMLQQTRVAAVIAHYHEFLRRFPTVEKLAAAREASVLAAWSGLGYYRRARMLHAAAKVVVRELGGKFPTTAAELLELPGVGRYTAAAIASIAFGEPVAVVDGNVERVLQRVSGRRLAGEKLWDAAEALLDRGRPGDFNQALMELGATVCTPRSPACLTCPVIELCATRGEIAGAAKSARQKKREVHYALGLRDGDGHAGKVFLVQRPPDARLMAGMWELPEVDGKASGAEETARGLKSGPSGATKGQDPSPEAAAFSSPERKSGVRVGDSHQSRRDGPRPLAFSKSPSNGGNKNAALKAPRQPNAELNADSASCFTLKHSITVTNYTVRVWRTNASSAATGKWFPVERLSHVALTGLARKVLQKAGILAAPGR